MARVVANNFADFDGHLEVAHEFVGSLFELHVGFGEFRRGGIQWHLIRHFVETHDANVPAALSDNRCGHVDQRVFLLPSHVLANRDEDLELVGALELFFRILDELTTGFAAGKPLGDASRSTLSAA